MALLQIRIDPFLKNQANAVLDEIGLDISTAVRMFLKKVVTTGSIPFDTTINEDDRKYLIAVENSRTAAEINDYGMSLEEINEEISAAREERRKKKEDK